MNLSQLLTSLLILTIAVSTSFNFDSDVSAEDNLLHTELSEENGLKTMNAGQAANYRINYLRSEKFKQYNEIEGINMTKDIIHKLSNSLGTSDYHGYRMYYAEKDNSDIAIFYPIDRRGREYIENGTVSYLELQSSDNIAPCPPLCDKVQ